MTDYRLTFTRREADRRETAGEVTYTDRAEAAANVAALLADPSVRDLELHTREPGDWGPGSLTELEDEHAEAQEPAGE